MNRPPSKSTEHRLTCPYCQQDLALTSVGAHIRHRHPRVDAYEARAKFYAQLPPESRPKPRRNVPPAPTPVPVQAEKVKRPRATVVNGHPLTADEVCAEVLGALRTDIPTTALRDVFAWHTATAIMLRAIEVR